MAPHTAPSVRTTRVELTIFLNEWETHHHALLETYERVAWDGIQMAVDAIFGDGHFIERPEIRDSDFGHGDGLRTYIFHIPRIQNIETYENLVDQITARTFDYVDDGMYPGEAVRPIFGDYSLEIERNYEEPNLIEQ